MKKKVQKEAYLCNPSFTTYDAKVTLFTNADRRSVSSPGFRSLEFSNTCAVIRKSKMASPRNSSLSYEHVCRLRM